MSSNHITRIEIKNFVPFALFDNFVMKLFLLVSVIQNGHVKEAASSINDNGTFADLLKEVLNSTNLPDMNVTVDYQCIGFPTWHIISKGINEDLAMC